jgi:hypothetical protein
MEDHQIKVFKECFKRVSIRELKDRIEYFKTFVNLRAISEEDLRKELFKLFSFDHNGTQLSFFLNSETYTNQYEHFNFYRIRKFTPEDLHNIGTTEFPSMKSEQDVWARPKACVTNFGRLNSIGESMLYTARQFSAVRETGCREGDFFFLLVYENKRILRLSQLHVNTYFEEFDELENAKQTILYDFLVNEFTKVVNPGSEYLYKVSIGIYKQFFNNRHIDAFTYPSAKSNKGLGYNVCFNTEKAKDCLNFCGASVYQLAPKQPGAEGAFYTYYDGFLNESKGFDFYRYDSEEARKRFGHFCLVRDMGLP